MKTKKNNVSKIVMSPKLIAVFLFVALIVTGTIAMYFYIERTRTHTGKSDDQRLVEELKKMIVLPNETPQITTIDNLANFTDLNPDFLSEAQIGDKIIQFATADLLYDPDTKIIKNIFNFDRGSLTRVKLKPLRIALRYSSDSGAEEEILLTKIDTFKTNIEQAYPQIKVTEVVKSNAIYESDLIFLIKKNRRADTLRFADLIGGSPVVDELELNEAPSDADAIIAFGTNSAVNE